MNLSISMRLCALALTIFVLIFVSSWSAGNRCRDVIFAKKNTSINGVKFNGTERNPKGNVKNGTAIALENCKKYEQYKNTWQWSDTLLIRNAGFWYRKEDCNHEVPLVYTLLARPKEFPHMALIGYGSTVKTVEWKCGGSLISEKFILSAAHCSTTSKYGAPQYALLGDLILESTADDDRPAIYNIIKVYDHPNYDPHSYRNNLALFELHSIISLSPYVRPACLHTSAFKPVHAEGIVAGWGRSTERSEQGEDRLLKASIDLGADERCKTKFDYYNSTSMICVENIQIRENRCAVDQRAFGAPLQVFYKNTQCMYWIMGVSSNDAGICGNKDPLMLTKVKFYVDWIQSIVWP